MQLEVSKVEKFREYCTVNDQVFPKKWICKRGSN